MEGDFGEFLGGIQIITGGAVVIPGAGDAGLEEIKGGSAVRDGDLTSAGGGIGFLAFDEIELGSDQRDECGIVAPCGIGDGGFSLNGELAEHEDAGIRKAAELAFFPTVGGEGGEAGSFADTSGDDVLAYDGFDTGVTRAERGLDFVERAADIGGGFAPLAAQ